MGVLTGMSLRAETIPGRILDYDFRQVDGGVVKDMSGHGHDGTLKGGATTQSDQHGPVLSLNGMNQYVTAKGFSSFKAERGFTVTAVVRLNDEWSKEREPDCFDGFVSSVKPSFLLARGANNKLYFRAFSGATQKWEATLYGEPPPVGRYIHVAMTAEYVKDPEQGLAGYDIKLWLDAKAAGGAPFPGLKFVEFGDEFFIGTAFGGDGPWAMNGRIASVHMYDRALAEGELLLDAKESPYVKGIKGPLAVAPEQQIRLNALASKAATPETVWLADLIGRLARDERFVECSKKLLTAVEAGAKNTKKNPLAAWNAAEQNLRIIEGGDLHIALAQTATQCQLAGIYDRAQKRDLLGDLLPVWTVKYVKPDGKEAELTSDTAVSRLADGPVEEGGITRFTMEWDHAASATEPVAFTVRSAVKVEGRRVSMNLALTNRSPDATVLEVVFPTLGFKRLDRGTDISVEPHGFGEFRRDPVRKNASYQGMYPHKEATMQFGAYYDDAGGVYFAAEDPEAQVKTLSIQGKGGQLETSCRWYVGNDGRGGNSFSTPGESVVEAFDGNWFDAGQIYKRWLAASAPWFPQIGRPDTPQWYKEVPMWLVVGNFEKDKDKFITLKEYLGLPFGIHEYEWSTWGNASKGWPHHVAPDGYREKVAACQQAGFYYKPYMDYYLWSRTDDEDQKSDFEYKKIGLPSAAKNRDGTVAGLSDYRWNKGDVGSVMCPAAQPFQQKIEEILTNIAAFGVDAIYLDQMGAATPYICFDANHGHAPGSGRNWIMEGYRKYLSQFRKTLKEAHPKLAFDTEDMAEPYADLVDGYLTYSSIAPLAGAERLPLHPSIYGGRVQYIGKLMTHTVKGSTNSFFGKVGEALVQGETLMRGFPKEILSSKERMVFIKRMAYTRKALFSYFINGGEMARPLVFTNLPTFRSDWGVKNRASEQDCPVVVHAAWKRPGSIALVFVNVTSNTVSTEVAFDGSRYGLPAGDLSLQRCDGTARGAEKTGTRFALPLTIPPYSPEVWIIRSAGDAGDRAEDGRIAAEMGVIRDFK